MIVQTQLDAEKLEDREKAAAALQAMGRNAAKALAKQIKDYIGNGHRPDETALTTKAITVLAKIGSEIADDCKVREALLSAAESNSSLQLRLAAIDALGEINKYTGIHFSGDDDDPIENFDPKQALNAADGLAKMADKLFNELLGMGKRYDDAETAAPAAPSTIVICCPTPKPTSTPSPSPTPTPTATIPTPQDAAFHDNITDLHKAQSKLLEVAAQASTIAASPKEGAAEPMFVRLANAKALAESLKKIEVAYLNTTKTAFAKKPADQADDKSHWQLKTEAAYDFLSEATQLRDEVVEASNFTDGAADLKRLLSRLTKIAANDAESSVELQSAVASAINKIFAKPPEKKAAAEGAKKDAKKDEEKKDGDKKDDSTAKDADKAKSKTE